MLKSGRVPVEGQLATGMSRDSGRAPDRGPDLFPLLGGLIYRGGTSLSTSKPRLNYQAHD